MALESRFAITCMSRSASAQTRAPGARSSRTSFTPYWSAYERFAAIPAASSGSSSSSSMRNSRWPDSIFSRSRMSLTRRVSRSLFLSAMSSRPLACGGIGPAAPEATRPRAPRMEVSGVRSSWLTVDTNSFLSRSTSRLSEMSLTDPPKNRPSDVQNSNKDSSNGKTSPLLRLPSLKDTVNGNRFETTIRRIFQSNMFVTVVGPPRWRPRKRGLRAVIMTSSLSPAEI